MKYFFLSIACASALTAAEQTEAFPSVAQHCSPDLSKATDLTYRIYGEFFYMQPNSTDLYYGAFAIGINPNLPSPANVASPNWKILEINPGYHPGFELGASILLNKANVEIGANWQWLHCEDSNSFQTSNAAGNMVGPFFDIGPNSASYKIAKGTASSHFDEVNFIFAKNLCFFNNFHTRFYGAASFLRIKQNLTSTYSNVSSSIIRNVTTSSTFTAGGPQIGIDYDYRIYKGFFFSGKSALSLFVGQMQNGTTYQSYTPELNVIGLGQPNNQATTINKRVQTVPAFEQKLGFSYLALWDQVKAIFEIGYRCQVYLNAVQSFNMASQVVPTALVATPDVGVFAVAFEQTKSNFMLTGPYAMISIDF